MNDSNLAHVWCPLGTIFAYDAAWVSLFAEVMTSNVHATGMQLFIRHVRKMSKESKTVLKRTESSR